MSQQFQYTGERHLHFVTTRQHWCWRVHVQQTHRLSSRRYVMRFLSSEWHGG
ncbi:hypothetical protein HanIR_Chr15g0737651 [Helianthus annuus]|nr:hypothetical protein HanIR_Chr15g0737651 [Helianthus annuus]